MRLGSSSIQRPKPISFAWSWPRTASSVMFASSCCVLGSVLVLVVCFYVCLPLEKGAKVSTHNPQLHVNSLKTFLSSSLSNNLIPPPHPSLRGRLPQVNLLCLVSSRKGVQQHFLQLGLGLFIRPRPRSARDADIRRAVQDVLAVQSALAQGGPPFGVVIVGVRGGGGCCGDVVLQSAEVGEELGYAGLTVGVYCYVGLSVLVMPGYGRIPW